MQEPVLFGRRKIVLQCKEARRNSKTTNQDLLIKYVDSADPLILVRMNDPQTIWSAHDIRPVLAREWMDPAAIDNKGTPMTRAFLANREDHLQQMVASAPAGAEILKKPISSWGDCRLSCLNVGEAKKRSAGIWLTGWDEMPL